MANIKRLHNCRINIEGEIATGLLETVTLPEIEATQVEYLAIGIVGTPELPGNKIQAMRAQMVFMHQPKTPAFSTLMHNFRVTTQVIITADQANFEGETNPVFEAYKCVMRCRPVIINSGEFSGEDPVKPESEFTVDYILMEVDGNILYEIDAKNPFGIRVNGQQVSLVGGSDA